MFFFQIKNAVKYRFLWFRYFFKKIEEILFFQSIVRHFVFVKRKERKIIQN